jgi:LysR family hydrogen peroxide-inducible transcriptional activator
VISLVQLQYIVAVDTYRHFVTAAEKSFVTQPTLSMQIKKLEENLGVIIFDRSKQPVIPTPAGEKIIAKAREILSKAGEIQELAHTERDELVGELHLGIIPSLAPYLLPLFTGNIQRKYPRVRLIVKELLTDEIITHLRDDRIDLGLLVTPLHERDIEEQILFYEEMKLYVNQEHELSAKPMLYANDIASPELLLMSQGHCFRSQVINLCEYQLTHENNMPFEFESGSLDTLKRLVEREGGFTILPELACGDDQIHKSCMVRAFNSTPLREVSLVRTRRYYKKRLFELIASEVKASVPQKMLSSERGQLVEWRST